MAPPSTILDLRAEALLGSLGWTDISTFVYLNKNVAGAVVTRGHPDESTGTNPSSLTLTLDNRDGRFSSKNPAGPYYGNLVRNTQVRVSVPEGASYLRSEGNDQGSYAYCPDTAGISVTGDTEIQLDVTLDNWNSKQVLCGKWFDPMNQRSWKLTLNEDGTLAFLLTPDNATILTAVSAVPVPVPPLKRQAIKVTYTTADSSVRFYTAPAAVNQAPLGPITTGWVQLGGVVFASNINPNLVFDSTANLYAGGTGQLGWMSDGPNVHSCFVADATTTRVFFDTPEAFVSGGNPLVNPVQDGLAATPILNYVAFAQFKADVTNANFVQNGITYTPNGPINALFKWVRYDVEGGVTWNSPIEEKQDPQTFIANFCTLAHANGFKVFLVPGRDLGSTDTAHPKLAGETLDQWYIRTNLAAVCANNGDLFEVQDQANQAQPGEFAGFFNTVRGQAKAANPASRVWCGLSVTYGNGLVMYQSAQLVPLADGFWFNIIGNTTDSLDLMRRIIAGPLPPQIPNMQGKVHSLKLLQGIGGTVKASPDFTVQTPGAATFTDAQSNAWKLYGTTEISNRKYRMHGEVASWPQGWDPSGSEVYVSVTANGLLRRLNQGNRPVVSAMRRYWTKVGSPNVPVAYWPCEDAASATSLASGLPGGTPMTFAKAKPAMAAASPFACSGPLPTMSGARIGGLVPGYTATTANQVTALLSIPAGGETTLSVLLDIAMSGPVAHTLLIYTSANGGSLGLGFVAGDGSGFAGSGPALVTGVNGQNLAVSIAMLPPANSTQAMSLQVLQAGATVPVTGTGSITLPNNVMGAVTGVSVNANEVSPASGSVFGHIVVQGIQTDLSALAGPLAAWAGEPAGTRFQRLCGEEGVGFRGQGRLSTSVPMGAQTQQILTSLLQECADADRGVMLEPRQQLALGYRTLSSLRNQPAAVALDYAAAHLAGALTPVEDDQTTANDVTVSRQGGSSYRLIQATGPLSVQPPPAGVGAYSAGGATLNVASDSQAFHEAGWLLHMGTVDESRYPLIQLILARTAVAGLYYDLQDADLGDRITVANPPAWLPPEAISQLVQQATERLGGYMFELDWTGVPASPYTTAVVTFKADTDGATLGAAITTTAKHFRAVTGTNANGGLFPLWTTAQADLPFDIRVGPAPGWTGERMTVRDIQGPPGNFLSGDDTDFDATAGNWTGAGNAAVAQVASPAHSGAGALRIRSLAAGDMTCASCTAANILTQGMACSPGDVILCSVWFETAAPARTCNIGAGFYTNAGVSVSTLMSSASILDSASAYTKISGTVVAPATAAFCRLAGRVLATGAINEDHFADDAYLGNVTTGLQSSQTFTVVRSVNGVVRIHAAGESVSLFTPSIVPLA